ncbi:hypothetical protein [Kosakonia pseudosacchari]|uniref:hypothetical protein n=1 Tax=Kosakonia pseudosacchari TaxID=1646340 RepID=UPI003D950FC8
MAAKALTRKPSVTDAPVCWFTTVTLRIAPGILKYIPILGSEFAVNPAVAREAVIPPMLMLTVPAHAHSSGLTTQYPLCGVVLVKVFFSGFAIEGTNSAVISIVAADEKKLVTRSKQAAIIPASTRGP